MTDRGEDVKEQLAICRRCLVRVECLAAGVRGQERGIWGATSARARKQLVKVSVADTDHEPAERHS